MGSGARGAPTPTLRVHYVEEFCADPTAEANLLLVLPLPWRAVILLMGATREMMTLGPLLILERVAPSRSLLWERRRRISWQPSLALLRRTPPRCPVLPAVVSAGSSLLAVAPLDPQSLGRLPQALTMRRAGLGGWKWPIRCMSRAGAHRDLPLRFRIVALPLIAMGTCSPWGAPTGATAASVALLGSALGNPNDAAGAAVLRNLVGIPRPPAERS